MSPRSDEMADRAERAGFSGVVRIDRAGNVGFEAAYGLAHRGYGIPNTVDTRFAMASGSKGFTALAVVSLIEAGELTLATTARSVLGADLPLIDEAVTVEQLLAHRSGIGDYFDEDAGGDINDYALTVPVQDLATTEAFVPILGGFPTKFPPGARFSYCNGGFVVLALIAERVSGVPFHDLVQHRVLTPAGLADTAYLRSDELQGPVAVGYVPTGEGFRSNVFHLPVRGSGDGGAYTTAADMSAFWRALFAGRIIGERWRAEMMRARSEGEDGKLRYGLGFWRAKTGDTAILTGYDAGVSFRSWHDPGIGTTHTVIGNTSEGVWPIADHLAAR